MKQKLFKAMLLLCALVAGSTNVWAADPDLTLDFTSAWTAEDDNGDGEKVFSSGGKTICGNGGANFKFNSGYFIFGKTNAYVKLPQVDFDVEKIEVVGNSGASGFVVHNIYVGDAAASSPVTGLNATTSTFNISSSYQAANTQYILKITSNHNAQVTYIKYYRKSGGSSSAVATTTTIDATGITNKDVHTSTAAGSLSASVTVTAGGAAVPGANVTWTSSDTGVATIGETTGVVTLVAAGTTTITATYAGVENEYQPSEKTYNLTVTNSAPATLPFNWTGGTSAALLAETGVTAYNLGDDYGEGNAPYRVKFDGTGDYIQIITDSQPDKVTIGVKMIGGSSSSSITVQESPDGTAFTDVEELTISGSQNDIRNLETTNSFAASTRYVRLVFTKGSNVGVGPITITSTNPAIVADNVELTAEETSGSITYTISNPAGDGVLTAAKTAGEWLSVGAVSAGSVAFTCTANTSDERTATVRLTYTYNTSETITKDVTITQAAYVAPVFAYKYELYTGTLVEGDYILVYEDNAMNTTVSSNRLQYTAVTPDEDVITTDNSSIVWHIAQSDGYWTIYNASEGKYAASTSTNNQAQLESSVTNNSKWTVNIVTNTYDFVNSANSRYLRKNGTYGFACYGEGTGGALSLYKKVTEPVSITDAGYATFASTNALDFTGTGIDAYIAITKGDGTGVTFTPVTKVPANTGILLYKDGGTASPVNVPAFNGTGADDVDGNKFVKGTDAAVVSTDGTNYNYVLYNGGSGLGFYKANNKVVASNKAYISVQEAPGFVKEFIALPGMEDDADGLERVQDVQEVQGAIFNLAGQRLSKMQKGINIVNGKKILY